ncbi:hypothetical protein Tco_1540607 [Tanacetum coccineum]
MKDDFVSVENDLDETYKQNELLKDQLLEASLTEDIKNLIITSCVEIRNKDLHDETERISKESKDVSNKSKIADTVCNDAFEVTQELSKGIVELEKYFSKFEAKSITFEIALQHKSRENTSLKTLQKENENFMASLEIENAHLKQNYKDLFDSVQRSRVETNHCDEVNVKVNFDEIETKNIELEYQVTSLIKENEHLKLTYQSLFDLIKMSRVQTKTSNVTQNETENLKSQLFEFAETKFNNIFKKIEFFKKKQLNISKLNKESREKHNLFENETSVFQIKIDELEKSLAKQIKENSDLVIKIDNLENVFADEEKRATLGKLNAFDNENCDFESKVIHLEKIIAQKSKDFDGVNLELSNRTTFFPQKGFKTRASNAKNQSFETSHSCFTPVKQVWRPIKESQTFEASSSQKSFKTSTLKGKNQVFVTPHSRFTPVKQVWRPKQGHLKIFKYSKSETLSMQNKNDLALKTKNNGRFSNASKRISRLIHQMVTINGNFLHEQDLKLHMKHRVSKINGKSKGILNLRVDSMIELFSNETPVSSSRWNSTSLHRIDTTLKCFSKLGKPVSTVLKWVLKIVV